MDLVFHQEIIPHQSFFTTGDYAIALAEREKNDISVAIPKLKTTSLNPGFHIINLFLDHENSFEILLI
ncbi:hypothetical protein ASJ81_14110 [Methanosarcina spelaei]|uniref:Uncharacterized protein n=1 Tax=Methanosarcina spelaei TaxID=1036679 RepID=A0A2A2HYJ1_9EURY|nr:hypothetical protein ASJ81_14110 [Methanosarcina spelaei]